MISAPFVRGAHAAGKLSMGFWDHWVPGANDTLTALVNEWAAKEKVDVTIDYITSQGGKDRLTIAAESQAQSGHDILTMGSWWPHAYSEQLEPVTDVVEPLIKQNGQVNGTVEYLGKDNGNWLAVPACTGSQLKGPCSRIDLMKKLANIDVQAMYPVGSEPNDKDWTIDTFLKAAEACHKGGYPFGIGVGQTADSVDTAGAFLQAFGGQVVDAKGNITVKTDGVREWLEFYKKLMTFLPPDAPAWDDASNNKWLIAGKGAMIMNPPSAWAVAKRDAPQVAEQCWTHGFPVGKAGRFGPYHSELLGHLEVLAEQVGGQESARASLAAGVGRAARHRERWLRSAGVREPDQVQDLGRGRAAQGHTLPLSRSLQAPEAVDCSITRAAQGRPADLCPGNAVQHVRQIRPGREDGFGAGLGRDGNRRLHAFVNART